MVVMTVPILQFIRRLVLVAFLGSVMGQPSLAVAQGSPFPVPSGLESAVEFWKQVFSRFSTAEVILFDPADPEKIYSVLRAPENDQGRASVNKERARIAADYDLVADENRIRSQRGAKEHFIEGFKIAGRHLAQMQKIFRDEGLPPELAYLPLVESSFNIRARSGVGAVGMWQFMPETGKKFMRIDAMVDERRDPLASTRAAARLLKQNYQILGSWPLAITAYNHGTEGIFRAIKTVESENLVEIIRRYQSPTFGFASKNFYAEFLAVSEIAANSETYFPFLRQHRPLALQEVMVKRPAALQAVLKPAAISQSDFFEWNPALEPNTKMIPLGYRVKLPAEKIETFLAAHNQAADLTAVRKSPTMKPLGGRGTRNPRELNAKRPAKRLPVNAASSKASRVARGQGSSPPQSTLRLASR